MPNNRDMESAQRRASLKLNVVLLAAKIDGLTEPEFIQGLAELLARAADELNRELLRNAEGEG